MPPQISPSSSIEASLKLPSSILLPPLGYDGGYQTTRQQCSKSSPTTAEKKRVTFLPTIKLILIASRNEYKTAGLNSILWWTGSDFFGFQQSAHSELRLLSSYENINMKEARKKLYQPDPNDNPLDSLGRSTVSSSVKGDKETEMGEYDNFFVAGDDDDKDERIVYAPSPSSRNEDREGTDGEEATRSSFHKVSSLALIPNALRHQESTPTGDEAGDPSTPLFPKVSSLDGLAAAFRELEADDAKSSSWTPSTRGQALLAQPTSPWNDDNVLMLCVPVDKPAPLTSGPTYSWRSAMRRKNASKSTLSSSTLAFFSGFLVVAFVLVDRYFILNTTM